jgi:hypothetical protein
MKTKKKWYKWMKEVTIDVVFIAVGTIFGVLFKRFF